MVHEIEHRDRAVPYGLALVFLMDRDRLDIAGNAPVLGFDGGLELGGVNFGHDETPMSFRNVIGPARTNDCAPTVDRSAKALSAYLQAWMSELRVRKLEDKITNPVLLRALFLLFPAVAEKVADRYEDSYSADNFKEVLQPVFSRTKKGDLKSPGKSPSALYDTLRKQLESGFSIARTRRA